MPSISWTLRIFDHARMDAGRLVRWKLTLGLAGGSRTEWRAEPGLTIPDADPDGIVSEIEVEETGALVAIELDLDVSHTYLSDLRVSLESPTGLTATLHDRAGGSGDDIDRTFTAVNTAPLQAMVNAGNSIQGTWKLRITDHAARDIGKLNSWTLRLLTGAPGTNLLVPHRRKLRPARTLETARD
jgi:subtilisin-like proprotein convertase family protein